RHLSQALVFPDRPMFPVRMRLRSWGKFPTCLFRRPVANRPHGRPGTSGGARMQVVILCGGKGTRIRDVTDDVPKPMIPVGGRPILWHIMKGFAHHGFNDFILCLGYKSWV